jgi:hypothetical protein
MIKGSKQTAEAKAKIAEAAKGRKHSEVTIKKMSDTALRLQKEQLEEQQVHVLLKVIEAFPKNVQDLLWDVYCPQEAHVGFVAMAIEQGMCENPFYWDQAHSWASVIEWIMKSNTGTHVPPEIQALITRANTERAAKEQA